MRPAISLAKVLLPLPLAPSRPTRSSASSRRSRPCSTGALGHVAGGGALQPDQRAGERLGRIGEQERRHPLLDLLGDRLHARQRLDAALRLGRLRGLGLEAGDERLDVAALVVLLLLELEVEALLLAPRLLELVVAAGVERELALGQVQDRADGAVQQVAVVADDQHGVRVVAQVVLEPQRAFEVEVVGGLVEQQQVGLGEQHGGQRHAHAPAAGVLRAGRAAAPPRRSRGPPGCARPWPGPRGRRCRRAARGCRRCGRDPAPSPPRPAAARAPCRPPARTSIRLSGPPGASCATQPMRVARGTLMAPSSGVSSPAIRRSSVVLPEPLRPTRPTLWPAGMPTVALSKMMRPSMR